MSSEEYMLAINKQLTDLIEEVYNWIGHEIMPGQDDTYAHHADELCSHLNSALFQARCLLDLIKKDDF